MVGRFYKNQYLKLQKKLVAAALSRDELNRALLAYNVILIASCSSFLFLVLDLCLGNGFNALIDLFNTLAYVGCLALIYGKKITLAKHISIIATCLTLIVNASTGGRDAGNQYIFFPLICGTFIIFGLREYLSMLLSLLAIAIAIVFLEITNYQLLQLPHASQLFNQLNYYTCMLVSIVLLCFYIYYLIQNNNTSERKLNRFNQILKVKNENLAKINSELDSFVYKASHDLRAPLTSLLGLIEIAKDEKDVTKMRSYINMQEKSIQRLDSYIVDILNLSRNARLEISLEEIKFFPLIEEVLEELVYLDKTQKVRKHIDVIQTHPFYSDIRRLKIIFNNLISNSLRYMDYSKAGAFLDIIIRVHPTEAYILIRDNGIGIPKEHQEKIFDMFYRATDISGGSGLGLYIVRETVMKLNGKINLKSEPRKDTLFEVVIPNQIA